MTPALKASLLATLRAKGPSKLADELEKLPLWAVQAYLDDFAKRQAPAMRAIREGATAKEAMRLVKR